LYFSFEEWPKIKPYDATRKDVIICEEQKDIMPLIIANSHYNVGRNEKPKEIDFESLERHIRNQFLDDKPGFEEKKVWYSIHVLLSRSIHKGFLRQITLFT
jgi:hypothetical protein